MPITSVIPRNQIQKIPTSSLNTRLVGATLIFYTCPSFKTAIIEGTSVCTGLGAAAIVRLNVNSIEILQWNVGGLPGIGARQSFKCQLDAGETLAKSQDSGTNGEVNVNATILETPA